MRKMILCFALAAGPALAEGGPLPPGALADYQLGGAYPPPEGVTVVVRDATDQPEAGYFNICYVNGFQTQPGADWPPGLLVPGADGKPLADPNWPDEFLLDIASPEARAENLKRVLPALRACAERGFDAVEFDNLDSYTRSDGHLTLEHAVAFAKLLVAASAELGLPAGQKNTAELAARGRDEVGFTFAVSEECHHWDECAAYTGVYEADQVLGIEYIDDLPGSFADACAAPDRPGSLILRDRLLQPKGADGYFFDLCS